MSPYDADPPPLSLTRAQIAALEAEARGVLAEVEPRHSASERNMSTTLLLAREVDLRPYDGKDVDSTVRTSDWRPRATRTRSGWAIAGGWLDAAVPELPTLPERGVRVRLLADRVERARREEIGGVIGELLGPFATQGAYALADPTGAVREMRSWWHRARAALRITSDTGGARGWCVGLGASGDAARTSGIAGWRAMQRYCATAMQTTDAQWTEERAAIVAAQSREAT